MVPLAMWVVLIQNVFVNNALDHAIGVMWATIILRLRASGEVHG